MSLCVVWKKKSYAQPRWSWTHTKSRRWKKTSSRRDCRFLDRRIPQVLLDCSVSRLVCTMATYQFQRILLLAVLIANSFRLNSAMFEQPDSQSKEQMDATPTCFRRPYTFKVNQEDSEGRSCWDVVTVTSCWGRCSSNEVISPLFNSS